MSTRSPTAELLDAIRPVLVAADQPLSNRFVPLLDRAASHPSAAEPTAFPLGDFPDLSRLTDRATAAATRTITALADQTPWGQPPADIVPPGWAHGAAATELVGPDGSITGLGVERFGLFYLSPGLDYPDHWHDAEEFYLVLAGSAEWTIDATTTRHGPGGYSFTPPRARHRIVTHGRPVLAVWGWAGETGYDSYGF